MFVIRIEIARRWGDRRFDGIFFPKGDAIRYRLPQRNKFTIGWHLGKTGRITAEHIAKSNRIIAGFKQDGPVCVSLGKGLKNLSPHYPVSDWMVGENDLLIRKMRAANDSHQV